MTDMPGSAGPNRGKYRRGAWWAVCLTVGTVAFLARLVPVLRSGGLSAINAYDAAIYFGAAVGLTHGRLPYRDFLLLHHPAARLPSLRSPHWRRQLVTGSAGRRPASR